MQQDNLTTMDLIIPNVGQTGEIELVEWKVPVGGTFEKGDDICDLVTDKAAFSLEAPVSGTLLTQLVANGEKVISGQIAGKVDLS